MMRKYFKLHIFLMVLMILGSFPGIYAINIAQHDNVNIGENNNDTDNTRTIYVAKNGTDRNDGLTPETPKRNIEVALEIANSGDTIRLGPGIYNTNLRINKNITLIGDNQNNTLIDGQTGNSCIYISGVRVTIVNLTLKNEKGLWDDRLEVNGGGIYNDGILTLENSTITNSSSRLGGGIYNDGTVTIRGVTITNNTAKYNGGGICNYEHCTLTIENSTITNNTSTELNGGGIGNVHGTVTIRGVTITNNIAKYNGGGICNYEHCTIENSTINNNHADQYDGGGICNNGELTVEDSTIRNNTAPIGAGIYNTNLLTVYGSTIINNMARDGGGIYNGGRAYLDDITVGLMGDNRPNNVGGNPFIPA
ncbi:right-handed parallel beta-helix repeat-containing protein [Methanobacterium sp. SMA-27]|uniref:right-handed parallel beta-helix repeat-containing protein n=1 Tax=Methanobacterium sp. SMA-27 TaxID=1495336 RepID=UPI0006941EC5|nr:right-handed parallel beta-helix repeat-containing protein [Methanobacterium sp. SMA-27]